MMSRTVFDREIQQLVDRMLALGSQVGSNIIDAVDGLQQRDMVRSQELVAADEEINSQWIAIMSDALTLIATQQPMAGDMRLIASVIEITGELERINDYVKGIARNSLLLGPGPLPEALAEIPQMAQITSEMLERALDAASRRDVELARSIPTMDDEVDALFNLIYRNLLTYAMENPSSIEQINYLEWVAHNIERAADRVTNICEWVVYAVVGEYVEMDSEFEAPPSLDR
jgi:phosphate transport system protein